MIGQDERTKIIFKNLVSVLRSLTLGDPVYIDLQVTHLHDFVRETSITTEEWMYVGKSSHPSNILTCMDRTAIQFLTACGQKCTDIRQGNNYPAAMSRSCMIPAYSETEFILLSDVLGVSSLIDSLSNAKPPGATVSTVLGPFFTEDAHDGMLVTVDFNSNSNSCWHHSCQWRLHRI
jgi:hypothetical protein